MAIEKCVAPANSLLNTYADNGHYTDCYYTDISSKISHKQFIIAFYTSPLFKLERFILRLIVAKPSTDKQVIELANANMSITK